MFIQLHLLTSFPASLLNRDDSGFAKRIPFGDAIRLRVSSQCLKRHWRMAMKERMPAEFDDWRSNQFFMREVLARVCKNGSVDHALAADLVEQLQKAVFAGKGDAAGASGKGKGKATGKAKSKSKAAKVEDVASATEEVGGEELNVDTAASQNKDKDKKIPVLFGAVEAAYYTSLVVDAVRAANASGRTPEEELKERLAEERKGNLPALQKSAAGMTAALFGRMVTSTMLSRVDASVHVAHAMTVHAGVTELDYFTAVDDLAADGESGANYLGATELAAGLYYTYVVIDLPQLISNVTGLERGQWQRAPAEALDKALAVVDQLIQSIVSESPGAKRGSTAPYARPDVMLLEVGREQPRSLANAFLKAVPMKGGSLSDLSEETMASYLGRVEASFGTFEGAGGVQRFITSALHPTRFGETAARAMTGFADEGDAAAALRGLRTMPAGQAVAKALDAVRANAGAVGA